MLVDIKDKMKNLWYKYYDQNVWRYANAMFQKSIEDNKWIKYYIDFYYYENLTGNIKYSMESYVQFKKDKDNLTIDVNMFSIIINDINKFEKDVIKYEKEYEEIFNKMWYDYYESIYSMD